jgi:tetratricopeptide (TPR) repeat protein
VPSCSGLGVEAHEAELQSASEEFNGHCLALTLLGSYLTDAYNGDIRRREEVSKRLSNDVRQGVHARKVMESYRTWFGEGSELSVLRMLGLFDRPADEKVIGALLRPPAIHGLTESLTDLSPTEWRTILAKLFREALNEVYIPRIQRGNACFAANNLGARGALLSVLVHFFEHGSWGSPVEMGVNGQSLTAEDRLFILMQAALYLSVTRGHQAPEVRICYERAERLCHSVNRPLLLYVALIGQWRYSLVTEKLSVTMQIAKRVYSLAQEQNSSALLLKARMALAATLYYLGDFEASRQYAIGGVQLWRSGGVQSQLEEVDPPIIACLCHEALIEWHFGEIASCKATMAETISLAKELNDIPGLAVALNYAAFLGYYERNPGQAERLASDLIELSTRHHFAHWRAMGTVLCGWARSASGDAADGISRIEEGIEDLRADGSMLGVLSLLTLKAEALYVANRISEALEVTRKAEALVERFEGRWWCAELYRLRGVFLAALDVDEAQIEASFCAAIGTAKKQKSISLAKRAEASYAEYRRQKAKASGRHNFHLPLC